MNRKSVLAAGLILIFVSVLMLFTSCSLRGSHYALHEEYEIENEYISPYLLFDTKEQKWHTGQGMVYDHNLNGEYTVNGDNIVCREAFWNLQIELKLIGNETIKVISIKDEDDVLLWLNEGDVLTHFDKS